jgi:UDP-3-O-[3-hydroxymyristoyl] glucosamine N-acyltransferase
VTPVTLSTLVSHLGGELYGDSGLLISGLAPLESATGSEISFLSHPKYQQQLAESKAGCVIVSPVMAQAAAARGAYIVTSNPYLFFARLTQLWRKLSSKLDLTEPLIHPSAVVDPSACIASSARIGPLCVVEAGATVGDDTVLYSRVTLGAECHIGARCVVHSGVVIGADGFGFAQDGNRWVKIEQLGGVRIGNDVEIGANTCIDRGALRDTVIEDGVKLDNLIQIGHNVHVGANTAMAGCVGVAGSATIGPNCTVGGGAIILGHLTLAEGVHISAATVVSKSIHQPGHYTGVFPLDDNANWERNAATLKQLHRLRDRIKHLENEKTS